VGSRRGDVSSAKERSTKISPCSTYGKTRNGGGGGVVGGLFLTTIEQRREKCPASLRLRKGLGGVTYEMIKPRLPFRRTAGRRGETRKS